MNIKDDDLFAALSNSQMHRIGGKFTDELIKQGYLTHSNANTEKAEIFIKNYYESKKDMVLKVIVKKNGRDTIFEDIQREAGIANCDAIDAIIRKLEDNGIIKQVGIVIFDII